MDPKTKRILFYMILAAGFYLIATFFTESQQAFVAVFGVGLLIGIVADLLFWVHMARIGWRRRNGARKGGARKGV